MAVGSVLCDGSKVQSKVKNLIFLSVIHTENAKGLLGLIRNEKEKENVSFPEAGCMYTSTQSRILVTVWTLWVPAVPGAMKG